MKKPKTTLILLGFLCTFFFWMCQEHHDNGQHDGFCHDGQIESNLDSLMVYLNGIDFNTNSNWHLFPLKNGPMDSLKRLGLPVHGRWVTTYVNQVAFDYIKANETPDGSGKPLEFPCGSFIVKDNYRTPNDATEITADQSQVMVRTFLYKPEKTYCVTANLADFNGEDCYGGDWFYGFYFLNQKVEKFRKLTKKVQANVASFCVNCHAPAYNADYVRTMHGIRQPLSQPGELSFCGLIEKESKPGKALPASFNFPPELAPLETFYNDLKLSPTLPPDVPVNPADVVSLPNGPELAQLMFDDFAWKTFVALSWPNKLVKDGIPQRGEPDKNLPFAANSNQPMVWETYKPTFEVFQPGDVSWDPSDQAWNQQAPHPVGNGCEPQSGELVLTMTSKARDVPNETGQAFAGSFGYLVDRNREQVRYEVLFNRTEFEYLISEGRASTKKLTPSGPQTGNVLDKITFPDNREDNKYNEGAIEVKSAWKSLCFGESGNCNYADAANYAEAKKKFLVRSLLVYDEVNDSCYRDTMALIGLHIIRKTHWAPQWVWMTFEHRDNVPPVGNTSQEATFFDPNCSPSNPDTCWKLPFLDNTLERQCCPNVDLNRFVNNWADQPNQLTRLAQIEPQAERLNKRYQKLLKGTPFENYILVSAQWPLNGRNTDGNVNPINCADNKVGNNCYTMIPRYLRNTVIESYMSTYCASKIKPLQFSNRSCMSCHGSAGTDFSYVWLDAVSQRVPIER